MLPEREPDGQFNSFTEWVNKATSWIGGMNSLCADAKGRVCKIGKDFMLARDEGAFPVRYWHGEGGLNATEQRKAVKAYKAAMKMRYPWRKF